MRKLTLAVVVAGCLMVPSVVLASAECTVTITATVDTFAEWADATPAIVATDWDGHITAVDQTRTASLALTLYANVTSTVTPTAGTNSGILTTGTETLTTSYKVTGDVTVPDGDYMAAGTGVGDFFEETNTYSVTHLAGDGSYALTLGVQAVSPADRAPDAGDYSCGVVLTATW